MVAVADLMFQKEVAERIVAAPGTEHYGRLAVAAQWRSHRIALRVNRSAFVPPPKVTSAVVHIVPKACPMGVDAGCWSGPRRLSASAARCCGRASRVFPARWKRRSARDRYRTPRRNAQRRGVRRARASADLIRDQFFLGDLRHRLAAAAVGPRLIAADRSANCGQPLGRSSGASPGCLGRAAAPSSTIASPCTARASRSSGSSASALLVCGSPCRTVFASRRDARDLTNAHGCADPPPAPSRGHRRPVRTSRWRAASRPGAATRHRAGSDRRSAGLWPARRARRRRARLPESGTQKRNNLSFPSRAPSTDDLSRATKKPSVRSQPRGQQPTGTVLRPAAMGVSHQSTCARGEEAVNLPFSRDRSEQTA